MLPEYLSQVKKLVKDKMLKSISNNNKIEEAMAYSALADSKMIRAGLVFASSETNKNIVKESIITLSSAVELMHTYSLIHDDLPCMDDDKIRRGKPSAHIKFGESTAVLAGNSLLTMAFEILASPSLKISEKIKINLIKKLSECSGHLGIAGGQYLDLSYEKKKISKNKIIEMEIKKTGKLFSFCCAVPAIIKKKNTREIKFFENMGSDIGLLFQIADDLIDFKGSSKIAGKKTGKDQKKARQHL